ncbi:methyl-accepting chemotaxis protein [Pelosinus sp. sgz500959]|uniref:methyl-accepting chemotaxis protein n=1 Tax=Pelosinus sp. sgz500959 TaxID=3242472 RepID=UPI00366FF954
MKLTLQKKIIGGLSILLLFTMIIAGSSIYMIDHMNQTLKRLDKTSIPQALLTEKVATNVALQVMFIRGYLLTSEESYVQEYKKISEENSKWEDELAEKSLTERGKILAQEVKKLNETYDNIVLVKIIPLKQSGKEQEALSILKNEGDSTGKALIGKIHEYVEYREQVIGSFMKQARQDGDKTEWTIGVISVFSLLAGVGIGIFVNRSALQPIKAATHNLGKMAQRDYTFSIPETARAREDEIGELARGMHTVSKTMKDIIGQLIESSGQLGASSEELTASAEQSALAANQIAETIGEVAAGASTQLQSIDVTTKVVEQMTTGIQKISTDTEHVANAAEQASTSAKSGEDIIEKATNQMKNIERTVGDSAHVVAKLGENSKQIGEIVDTISAIAGQTNLLALNAAIEAARAGDQGRGFAVVAEEVRKLAEQSQEASKHIANLIGEIQGDTDDAVVAMSKGTREVQLGTEIVNLAGKTFSDIASLVEQVSDQVGNISTAIQENASGSLQIISSIKEIDQISRAAAGQMQTVSAATEEQSASMEEIESSGGSLVKMAEDLQNIVNTFKV